MLEICQAVVGFTHIKGGFLVLNQSIPDDPHLPQDGEQAKLWIYYPHYYVANLRKLLIKNIQEGN